MGVPSRGERSLWKHVARSAIEEPRRMKPFSFAATRVALRAAGAASVLLFATAAGAQTITLAESNATTLRGGSYASTNFSDEKVLETRASSDSPYVRRALMKFDTHTTIPA